MHVNYKLFLENLHQGSHGFDHFTSESIFQQFHEIESNY